MNLKKETFIAFERCSEGLGMDIDKWLNCETSIDFTRTTRLKIEMLRFHQDIICLLSYEIFCRS